MESAATVGVLAIADRFDGGSDADLVARAQRGDLPAFEEVYRRHSRKIYALCLRMTAEPSRAEELTQDTFVRVWERLGYFKAEGGFFVAWLKRIAVNLVLSDRRLRARRPVEQPGDEATLPGSRPSSGTSIDLEKAVRSLPPRARAVFVLHDIEGYRHEEIGRLLDINPGTSKAQLHRARRLLREVLES